MNKKRRKELLKIADDIENIYSRIEIIRDEEQESLDNIPENLLETDRASGMEDNIEVLDEIMDQLECVINDLSEEF